MDDPAHDPDNTLIAWKWVRIMADYAADGVWDKTGAGCCADELPIEPTLVERLRAWQAWFDDLSDDNERNPDWDAAAFAREGLAIARAVKAALPDWTVIYFDEAALAAASRGAPHSIFQYEIGGGPA
jgi:hypothetical protein